MFLSPRHDSINSPGNTSGSEPMALGSPSLSPPGMLGTSSQYLPNYLMGELPAGVSSPSTLMWGVPNSPPKSRPLGLTPLGQSTPTNAGKFHMKSPSTPTENQTPSSMRMARSQGVKSGGPPVQGLFDSLTSPSSTNATLGDSCQPSSIQQTRIMSPTSSDIWQQTPRLPSVSFNQSTSKTLLSPAQIDPFYTQGESISPGEELDESWVTVFGFPPAAASYILQQFSQYGTIIEHKTCPNGNWMHIHYQSKLQAKKALSKNGKVFGNTIMVGVQPCIDKQAMDESTKENSRPFGTSSIQPTSPRVTPLSKIRPLTQSYKAAASDHEVASQNRTPQKKTDILSTAMEYVFGW